MKGSEGGGGAAATSVEHQPAQKTIAHLSSQLPSPPVRVSECRRCDVNAVWWVRCGASAAPIRSLPSLFAAARVVRSARTVHLDRLGGTKDEQHDEEEWTADDIYREDGIME